MALDTAGLAEASDTVGLAGADIGLKVGFDIAVDLWGEIDIVEEGSLGIAQGAVVDGTQPEEWVFVGREQEKPQGDLDPDIAADYSSSAPAGPVQQRSLP